MAVSSVATTPVVEGGHHAAVIGAPEVRAAIAAGRHPLMEPGALRRSLTEAARTVVPVVEPDGGSEGIRGAALWLPSVGVGVVIRSAGSLSLGLNAAHRVCEQASVTGVVIVTTQRWGEGRETANFRLHGKPVEIVRIGAPLK
jgi:hypothetical protein